MHHKSFFLLILPAHFYILSTATIKLRHILTLCLNSGVGSAVCTFCSAGTKDIIFFASDDTNHLVSVTPVRIFQASNNNKKVCSFSKIMKLDFLNDALV